MGKKILGNVVKTGMEVAGYVFSGKSAKEALKERGLAGIKRTFGDVMRQSPTVDDRDDIATVSKPSKRTASKIKKKKVVVKPKRRDIFG